MNAIVAVIDDDLELLELVASTLQEASFTVQKYSDPREAVARIPGSNVSIVLTDLQMPHLGGIDVLRKLKERMPSTPVILMTAAGTIRIAVQAMKEGAFDFLTKPLDIEHLLEVIQRALEFLNLERENKELREEVAELRGSRIAPVGSSQAMKQILEMAHAVATTNETVLITGESGSGKEVLADAIQRNSERKRGPFVKVNCAALTGSLLESELFGHEKGAFTGAQERRIGRFELADGGTIFLDEIGDMPLEAQTRLLRVLQQRELQRVGGNQSIKLDIRVLCATNKELKSMVSEAKFREDLYYRINVVALHLPSLRERKEDIPALALDLLRSTRKRLGRGPIDFTVGAFNVLSEYAWPGNIRELENVLSRCAIFCKAAVIDVADLPVEVREPISASLAVGSATSGPREIEKKRITEILEACDWNMSDAAKLLGISRSTLYVKLGLHGIQRK